ncbi:hypothetical protein GF366_04530 [Candidatus Peregrinibacteria bacterium]|nr:hypothetical protein [Candidatus Peregrinibacteria bacterium]
MSLDEMKGRKEESNVVDFCEFRRQRFNMPVADYREAVRLRLESIVVNAMMLGLAISDKFVFETEDSSQNVLFCEDMNIMMGLISDDDFEDQYGKVRSNCIGIDERTENMLNVRGSVTLFPYLCFLKAPGGQIYELYFVLDKEGRMKAYHCWKAGGM